MTMTNDVLAEIALEREAQDEKWGEQNHPPVYGESQRKQFAQLADHWKRINDARHASDSLSWDGIALEEVFEAFAEIDPTMIRAELVQAGAVIVAAIESIDRALASFEELEDEAA